MHSNARFMLRKNGAAVPSGNGAFRIFGNRHAVSLHETRSVFYIQKILLIHSFINQINSL